MRRGGALWLGTAVFALSGAPAAADTQTGRILVSLKEGQRVSEKTATTVAAAAAAVPDGPRVPQIGLVTLRPAPGVPLGVSLRALQEDPRVRAAAPEGRFALRHRPDDPALRKLDAETSETLVLQWAAERQGLFRAWDVTRGAGARVAIIDTGVDATHPDLVGKVVDGIDLDGGAAGGALEDRDGHGTHVASLACAATDNGVGIAGAGHDCSVISVKSDLTDASVAAGIVGATDRGAHAINMSFGDDGDSRSPALSDALAYAERHGVVLVAAAADEPLQEQGEPANLLQPTGTGADLGQGLGLSVTAADATDHRAAFAGRGSQISLAAYGATESQDTTHGLLAAFPSAKALRSGLLGGERSCGCRSSFEGDERWAYLAGTSMAAPQVAAVAAMIRRMNPALSAREVVRILKESARRPGGAGWQPELGWGILDAGEAVSVARVIDRRAPVSRLRVTRVGARSILRLRGADRARGGLVPSGLAAIEVFRSVDGAPAERIARRPGGSLTVRLEPGRDHAFHSVAVDHAGNREAPPVRPDAVLRG